MQWMIGIGALYGALGVGLGAYEAHGLEASLLSDGISIEQQMSRLDNTAVAVQYLLVHALALVSVGTLSLLAPSRWCGATGLLLATGTLLFAGGLAAHGLTGQFGHWAIIPTGGMMLIAGWIALLLYALFGKNRSRQV